MSWFLGGGARLFRDNGRRGLVGRQCVHRRWHVPRAPRRVYLTAGWRCWLVAAATTVSIITAPSPLLPRRAQGGVGYPRLAGQTIHWKIFGITTVRFRVPVPGQRPAVPHRRRFTAAPPNRGAVPVVVDGGRRAPVVGPAAPVTKLSVRIPLQNRLSICDSDFTLLTKVIINSKNSHTKFKIVDSRALNTTTGAGLWSSVRGCEVPPPPPPPPPTA